MGRINIVPQVAELIAIHASKLLAWNTIVHRSLPCSLVHSLTLPLSLYVAFACAALSGKLAVYGGWGRAPVAVSIFDYLCGST